MIDELEPVDFMTLERKFVEFLGASEFESRYREYRSGRSRTLGTSEPPSPGPIHNREEDHPLLSLVYQARSAFDNYWKHGELELTEGVLDIATLGRAVDELDGVSVVNPSGELIDTPFSEIYRNRMWNEEDFWDTAFELEAAALFSRLGFNVRLIEEYQSGGPDVLLRSGGTDVWIECKRKREKTKKEREYEITKKTLLSKIWNHLDIGEDSFAIRLHSDSELEEDNLERLAQVVAESIQQQRKLTEIDFGDKVIEFELIDYYSGPFDASQDSEDPSFIDDSEQYEVLAAQAGPGIFGQVLASGPLNHLDFDPPSSGVSAHSNFVVEASGDSIQIQNAYFAAFDFPNEVEYWKTVKRSVNSATENLSGYSPSGVMVDLPITRWSKMQESEREFGSDTVSGAKRLEISLKGILKDNSSLNFVTVTSRSKNRTKEGVKIVRNGYPIVQKFPKVSLPDQLESDIFATFTDTVDGEALD